MSDQDQIVTDEETQESPGTSITATPAVTPSTIATQPQGADLRSAILSKKALKEQALYVPEWGLTVTIREMTAAKRAEVLEASNNPRTGAREGKLLYPLITIASCFDPNTGQPIFQPTDRDELLAQGGTAMERVFQVASRISGLSQEYLEQTKNG